MADTYNKHCVFIFVTSAELTNCLLIFICIVTFHGKTLTWIIVSFFNWIFFSEVISTKAMLRFALRIINKTIPTPNRKVSQYRFRKNKGASDRCISLWKKYKTALDSQNFRNQLTKWYKNLIWWMSLRIGHIKLKYKIRHEITEVIV